MPDGRSPRLDGGDQPGTVVRVPADPGGKPRAPDFLPGYLVQVLSIDVRADFSLAVVVSFQMDFTWV
ncbi:hypothetical protein GCM10012285_18480 [Streptomyces kronopolitis]|uniref:Uncharacterized protein n=1 Tax=Streptomyces kronopolitis TaxID=1612435 RepID=A0ABQ2J572_9ACTN|nr:hypothetical protein GCM10012285_18480 [Streptomyces kronopolitis]